VAVPALLHRDKGCTDEGGDTGTGYMTKLCRPVEDLAAAPRDACELALSTLKTTRTFS
jgi:hypothetical protein